MTTATEKRPTKKQDKPTDYSRQAEEIRALWRAEDKASRFRERVDERGRPIAPDVNYWEAIEACLNAYDPRALPFAESRMVELAAAYKELRESAGSENDMFPVQGAYQLRRFFRVRDQAHEAIFAQTPRPIVRKSPTELKKEGVSEKQIACEWVWLDDGEPDIARVRRELDSPGSEWNAAAIAERHQHDLDQFGFVYHEPPAPERAAIENELTTMLEFLDSLDQRRSQILAETERLRGLLG